eukprot:gene6182-8361_t
MVSKRQVLPDPKFGDLIVTKFMNYVMYEGKKAVAENIIYGAFDILEAKRKDQGPLETFHSALDNVAPAIEVRSRRVGKWVNGNLSPSCSGYTQVVAGVAPTLRAENRQYAAIAASLNYTPPSFNAFDRLTDVGSPIQSYQDLGGGSLTADWDTGYGKFTSISAYRVWDWRPSNDRDFIGLPVNTISAAT